MLGIILETTGLNHSRYAEMIKMDFKPKPFQVQAYNTCLRYLEEEVYPNLIFTGDVGTGKTLLMVRMANRLSTPLMEKRGDYQYPYRPIRNVKFYTAPSMLREIKECYSNDGSSEECAIKQFGTAPCVLFLDDLDKIGNTEWACNTLWTIINERYVEMKTTVVSSNLTIEGIHNKYGEALASRLGEGATLIEMKGEDQRLVQAP